MPFLRVPSHPSRLYFLGLFHSPVTFELKNITLKLDEQLINRIRYLAVDENQSVSAWVAALIQKSLNEADDYEQTRREAFDGLGTGFHLSGTPLRREAMHDRG
ncbi:hypothetical protein C2W62_44455 [Candidatus Entotheonella serta]|nr:hypothetical protein C2W62_44455 [Candidatus Entotheonella serta]